MPSDTLEVFTVGHSTHSWERFVGLLRGAEITAIGDVRSAPYSRYFPHFNRDTLKQELRMDGISYVFLGEELGGRPSDSKFFCDGVADYEKMAQTDSFKKGIDRVEEGSKRYRIALLCSERDPLDCHRCLLVGRALAQRGTKVLNILDDGSILDQSAIEERLLDLSGRGSDDLFAARVERMATAYRTRARKVAFSEGLDSARSVG